MADPTTTNSAAAAAAARLERLGLSAGSATVAPTPAPAAQAPAVPAAPAPTPAPAPATPSPLPGADTPTDPAAAAAARLRRLGLASPASPPPAPAPAPAASQPPPSSKAGGAGLPPSATGQFRAAEADLEDMLGPRLRDVAPGAVLPDRMREALGDNPVLPMVAKIPKGDEGPSWGVDMRATAREAVPEYFKGAVADFTRENGRPPTPEERGQLREKAFAEALADVRRIAGEEAKRTRGLGVAQEALSRAAAGGDPKGVSWVDTDPTGATAGLAAWARGERDFFSPEEAPSLLGMLGGAALGPMAVATNMAGLTNVPMDPGTRALQMADLLPRQLRTLISPALAQAAPSSQAIYDVQEGEQAARIGMSQTGPVGTLGWVFNILSPSAYAFTALEGRDVDSVPDLVKELYQGYGSEEHLGALREGKDAFSYITKVGEAWAPKDSWAATISGGALVGLIALAEPDFISVVSGGTAKIGKAIKAARQVGDYAKTSDALAAFAVAAREAEALEAAGRADEAEKLFNDAWTKVSQDIGEPRADSLKIVLGALSVGQALPTKLMKETANAAEEAADRLARELANQTGRSAGPLPAIVNTPALAVSKAVRAAQEELNAATKRLSRARAGGQATPANLATLQKAVTDAQAKLTQATADQARSAQRASVAQSDVLNEMLKPNAPATFATLTNKGRDGTKVFELELDLLQRMIVTARIAQTEALAVARMLRSYTGVLPSRTKATAQAAGQAQREWSVAQDKLQELLRLQEEAVDPQTLNAAVAAARADVAKKSRDLANLLGKGAVQVAEDFAASAAKQAEDLEARLYDVAAQGKASPRVLTPDATIKKVLKTTRKLTEKVRKGTAKGEDGVGSWRKLEGVYRRHGMYGDIAEAASRTAQDYQTLRNVAAKGTPLRPADLQSPDLRYAGQMESLKETLGPLALTGNKAPAQTWAEAAQRAITNKALYLEAGLRWVDEQVTKTLNPYLERYGVKSEEVADVGRAAMDLTRLASVDVAQLSRGISGPTAKMDLVERSAAYLTDPNFHATSGLPIHLVGDGTGALWDRALRMLRGYGKTNGEEALAQSAWVKGIARSLLAGGVRRAGGGEAIVDVLEKATAKWLLNSVEARLYKTAAEKAAEKVAIDAAIQAGEKPPVFEDDLITMLAKKLTTSQKDGERAIIAGHQTIAATEDELLRAFADIIPAVQAAAILDEVAVAMTKMLAMSNPKVAKQAADIFTWKAPGLAAEHLEEVVEVFNRIGAPLSHTTELARSGKDFVIQMTALADEGYAAVIPVKIIEDVNSSFADSIKRLDTIAKRQSAGPVQVAASVLASAERLFRQSITTGVLLPRPGYYANMQTGNASQVIWTDSFKAAFRMMVQSGVAYGEWGSMRVAGWLPDTMARPIQAFWDDLRVKGGQAQVPPAVAWANPFINAAIDPRIAPDSMKIARKTGGDITVGELRHHARRQGIFTTMARESLRDVFARGSDERVAEILGKKWSPMMAFRSIREAVGDLADQVEMRNRMALFSDAVINQGYSYEAAGKLAREALYDWAAFRDPDKDYLGMLVIFWRYWRLASRQTLKAFMEPIEDTGTVADMVIKSSPLLSAATGRKAYMQARTRAVQKGLEGSKAAYEDIADPGPNYDYDGDGEVTEDDVILWQMRQIYPWWQTESTKPVLYNAVLTPEASAGYARYGESATHVAYALPAFTPLDMTAMSFQLGVALANLAADPMSRDSYKALGKTVFSTVGDLASPFGGKQIVEGIGQQYDLVEPTHKSRKMRLRANEVVLSRLAAGLDIDPLGVHKERDKMASRKVEAYYGDPLQVMLWRSSPIFGLELANYVEAFLDVPADANYAQSLAFVAAQLSGIGKAFTHDPGKTLKQRKVFDERERVSIEKYKESRKAKAPDWSEFDVAFDEGDENP